MMYFAEVGGTLLLRGWGNLGLRSSCSRDFGTDPQKGRSEGLPGYLKGRNILFVYMKSGIGETNLNYIKRNPRKWGCP
jgi:hypothetical protein